MEKKTLTLKIKPTSDEERTTLEQGQGYRVFYR